jgi:hypothetical protein
MTTLVTSPRMGERCADKVCPSGAPLELVVYDRVEHNFDDPGATEQTRDAERPATEDAMACVQRFFRTPAPARLGADQASRTDAGHW